MIVTLRTERIRTLDDIPPSTTFQLIAKAAARLHLSERGIPFDAKQIFV